MSDEEKGLRDRARCRAWAKANPERVKQYRIDYKPKAKEKSQKKRLERKSNANYVVITGKLVKIKITNDELDVLIKKFEVDGKSKSGLRWKDTDANRYNLRGKEVGCLNNRGYFYTAITINKFSYRLGVSTIVWMVAHKKLIEDGKIVNHKNRIRSDNRIENLDLADTSSNSVNKLTNGISGYKNVILYKNNKFLASFSWKGSRLFTKSVKEPCCAVLLGWDLLTSGKISLKHIKSQSDEWKDGSYLKRALAECKKQGIAVTPPKYKTLHEYIASVEGSC